MPASRQMFRPRCCGKGRDALDCRARYWLMLPRRYVFGSAGRPTIFSAWHYFRSWFSNCFGFHGVETPESYEQFRIFISRSCAAVFAQARRTNRSKR
jgi:hypothetical protein